MISVFLKLENIVEKGQIVGYQPVFSPFPTTFLKGSILRVLNSPNYHC